MAATDGVGKAFAIDLLDKDKTAKAVGYLGTVTGISTLIASTVAGAIWDRYGSAVTFGYGSLGAALTFITLMFLKIKEILLFSKNLGKTVTLKV